MTLQHFLLWFGTSQCFFYTSSYTLVPSRRLSTCTSTIILYRSVHQDLFHFVACKGGDWLHLCCGLSYWRMFTVWELHTHSSQCSQWAAWWLHVSWWIRLIYCSLAVTKQKLVCYPEQRTDVFPVAWFRCVNAPCTLYTWYCKFRYL